METTVRGVNPISVSLFHSLLMHVKSLHDSLEISVTHDYPSQLCSGAVCDGNSAKPAVTAAAATIKRRFRQRPAFNIQSMWRFQVQEQEPLLKAFSSYINVSHAALH